MVKCATATLLENEEKREGENGYLSFVPYFSNDALDIVEKRTSRLFDDTSEQISHGKASWDDLGWSRDGWVV